MSLLRVAAPLASLTLIFFSAFAIAQVSAPSCKSASWQWAFNSLGQSPCDIVAYMMSTCQGGEYHLVPLPPGYSYFGPKVSQNSNLCYCSTVGYSLYSACGGCQGETWINWSKWVTNCTKTLPPSSFPNPVPLGTRVPHWALLDVTNENLWNPNSSYAAGDSPELGPGSILSPSGMSVSVTSTSSSSASSTVSATPPVPPPTGGGSSNTGAIAGGAVGGVAAIFAVAAIFYLRRRSRARSALSAGARASQPPLSDEAMFASPSLPASPVTMKLYDPNDPTTFPGYQGPPSPDNPSQIGTDIGSGSTLAYTQTSLPQDRGYHGLPTV